MAIEVHSSGFSIKKYRAGAKALAKSEGISLYAALDRMAQKFSADLTPLYAETVEPLNWMQLIAQVWKLNGDNILCRTNDGILAYPYGLTPKGQWPIPVRSEITTPLLLEGSPALQRLQDYAGQYDNKVTMRSRVYRSVDPDGTLVERQVINGSSACFKDKSDKWDYSKKCDCCKRHEISLPDRSATLLKAALASGKLSDIAAFTVQEFDFADREPMLAKTVGWIHSTLPAERAAKQHVERNEQRQATIEAYERAHGINARYYAMIDGDTK